MNGYIPEILPDVTRQIEAGIEKEIPEQRPVRSNWASKLGHPCIRHAVHHRLDWRSKEKTSVRSQMRFGVGNVYERTIAKDYLEKAGYEITSSQRRPLEDRERALEKLNIACVLDYVVRRKYPEGVFEFPVEVKTVAPWIFDKVSTIEDMLESKQVWFRAYPAQLVIQMFGGDYEVGMFLLINTATGQAKHVWVHLDYSFMEELELKAKKVNEHVEARTYPERIAYDESICGRCDYAHVCLADVVRTEAEVVMDSEMEAKLDRREFLKPLAKEYDEIDGDIKTKVAGKPKLLLGDYLIIGSEQSRRVPIVSGYEAETKKYWKVSIKNMKKKEG